jgi:hypothetical protein
MSVYSAELFFEAPPAIDPRACLEAVHQFAPAAELLGGETVENALHLVHPDHPLTFSDAVVPAQTVLLLKKDASILEKLEGAFQQAWDFADARAVVGRATTTALLTDLMAWALAPAERVSVFQRTLDGLASALRPLAIHWVPADRLVSGEVYLAGLPREYPDAGSGPLNVRLFRVEDGGQPGDTVMDTLGLSVLGLPDVQIHFRALEPGLVASFLYSLGAYILQRGDIIADGDTVQGLEPDQKWRCQHERALAPPERVVLDVNPGRPYAAGRPR